MNDLDQVVGSFASGDHSVTADQADHEITSFTQSLQNVNNAETQRLQLLSNINSLSLPEDVPVVDDSSHAPTSIIENSGVICYFIYILI